MVADLSSEVQDTSSSTEFRHVRMEYVRSYLAPQLVARGLGEEQIAQQTLEELRELKRGLMKHSRIPIPSSCQGGRASSS